MEPAPPAGSQADDEHRRQHGQQAGADSLIRGKPLRQQGRADGSGCGHCQAADQQQPPGRPKAGVRRRFILCGHFLRQRRLEPQSGQDQQEGIDGRDHLHQAHALGSQQPHQGYPIAEAQAFDQNVGGEQQRRSV